MATWRLLAPHFTRIFGRRLRFIQTELFWTEKGKLFDVMGCDIFTVISPYDIKLFTRSAAVTKDLCANPMNWVKPITNYSKLKVHVLCITCIEVVWN